MGIIYLKNANRDETAVVVSNLTITRTLNQLSTISFDFDTSGQNATAGTMMVPMTTIEVPETGEMFRITAPNRTPLGKFETYSVNGIAIGIKLHNKYIEGKLNGSQSLKACLDFVLKGTDFKYKIHDKFNNYGFSDGFGGGFADDLLMNTLASNFGFEFSFDNYTIHIRKKLGLSDSFAIVDGLTGKTIKQSEDYSGIATSIKGYGKPKENDKGFFATATYTSPRASLWGVIDAQPISDERFKDVPSLTNHLKKNLQDYPMVQYTVDEVFTSEYIKNDVSVGNSGYIKDRYGVDIDVRIISVTDKPQDGDSKSVTFGNFMYSFVRDQARQKAAYKRNITAGKPTDDKLNGLIETVNDIQNTGIWYEFS